MTGWDGGREDGGGCEQFILPASLMQTHNIFQGKTLRRTGGNMFLLYVFVLKHDIRVVYRYRYYINKFIVAGIDYTCMHAPITDFL